MVFCYVLQLLPAFLKQLSNSIAIIVRNNFHDIHNVILKIYSESNVYLFEQKIVFC